jgi:RNA polymerase sigma factor (sigma-70 family)
MTTRTNNAVLQHLRRAILLDGGAGLTDGQLLGCFLDQRDEAAFAALVRRHGPMVLSVCRRIAGNVHDADDAFQATFLVFVRKAASVHPRELVANWLYGVAYNTARKARALAVRRQAREKQVTAMPEPETRERPVDLDLPALLDQELSRLPDKYRVPLVLCDLEGKSRKEAARQLGWLDGTLSGRLARARQLLAKRLTRRGFAVSAGMLAVVLAQLAAPASVPAALLMSTFKAANVFAVAQTAGVVSTPALTLAEGVLKSMLFAKLKMLGIVFMLVAVAGVGLGFSSGGRLSGQDKQPPEIAQKGKAAPSRDKEASQKDRPDGKVENKPADDKLTAEELARLVAQLREESLLLRQEIEVIRVNEQKRLQEKEAEIKGLKDEIVLLKNALVVEREASAERTRRENEQLAKVSGHPEKDLKMANFYLTTGHPETAAFYFELVMRRYPGTSYAKQAAKQRDELFEKYEKEHRGSADDAAQVEELKKANEQLKQQYEKARREAEALKVQIEQLRKVLDPKQE